MKTVLLIKNDNPLRENLIELLEDEGYKVIVEQEARDGLYAALNLRPDVIVCGELVNHPINHNDVLLYVRKNADLKDTPFISLFSNYEPHPGDEKLIAMADAYIRKPFHPDELLEALSKHIIH